MGGEIIFPEKRNVADMTRITVNAGQTGGADLLDGDAIAAADGGREIVEFAAWRQHDGAVPSGERFGFGISFGAVGVAQPDDRETAVARPFFITTDDLIVVALTDADKTASSRSVEFAAAEVCRSKRC